MRQRVTSRGYENTPLPSYFQFRDEVVKGKGYFFAANKDFRFDSGVRLEPVCNSLPICSPPSFDLNLLDSGANDDPAKTRSGSER